MNIQPDVVFKFIIIGDGGTGKSCMMHRFADDDYIEDTSSTIGIDFRFKTMEIYGKNVRIQIWDTAGQEVYRSITNTYLRGSHGIILCYDITNIKTFYNVDNWIADINKVVDDEDMENTERIIVGTKCDMESDRQVADDIAERYANVLGYDFIETSSKNNTNIDKLFRKIATKLVERKYIGIEHYIVPKKEHKKSCCT